ncbi:TPA: hypothetical protein I7730_00105 [Vibrio vulnificus]|uniref:Uncharacterized protein n=1 Tax=Vibrio vulnificus TaxID=672 RepID=A0A8H9MZ28_VIBVL|nr:hypothetical protein [Vibrio vulnificus]
MLFHKLNTAKFESIYLTEEHTELVVKLLNECFPFDGNQFLDGESEKESEWHFDTNTSVKPSTQTIELTLGSRIVGYAVCAKEADVFQALLNGFSIESKDHDTNPVTQNANLCILRMSSMDSYLAVYFDEANFNQSGIELVIGGKTLSIASKEGDYHWGEYRFDFLSLCPKNGTTFEISGHSTNHIELFGDYAEIVVNDEHTDVPLPELAVFSIS